MGVVLVEYISHGPLYLGDQQHSWPAKVETKIKMINHFEMFVHT